jgi:hypothetical protein
MTATRQLAPITSLRRWLPAALLLLAASFLTLPASGRAALTTVGSPLSRPATLNAADNLAYPGVNTSVMPSTEFPTGVAHTAHYGADTAIWNTAIAGGAAAMPEPGQAVKVRLEGCAQQAPGGPAPLTQIHFQTLSPQADGGVRVDLSSQPFNLPICGRGGASGTTVTTYEPINLCVNAGDYVDFNDEGGFVERFYRAGVPYLVMGAAGGSSLSSFIRGGGTNNGALFSPLDSTAMDGFASSTNQELMLQVVLGTGSDARYVCPGGTKDAPAALAPLHVRPQTDGINSSRVVSVAIYCRPASGCPGTATLSLPSGAVVGHASFALPGGRTGHLPIQVSPSVMRLIRKHHGVKLELSAIYAGQSYSQTITVKIF